MPILNLLISHTEAAKYVPWDSIKSSAFRWRRQVYGTVPKNLKEFHKGLKELDDRGVLNYTPANKWSVFFICDDNGDKHILFIDIKFAKEVYFSIKFMLGDGTFDTKAVLEDCYQLFVIMGFKYDKVNF